MGVARPVAESGPLGDPWPSHPKPHRKLECTLRSKAACKVRNIKHPQNQQGPEGPPVPRATSAVGPTAHYIVGAAPVPKTDQTKQSFANFGPARILISMEPCSLIVKPQPDTKTRVSAMRGAYGPVINLTGYMHLPSGRPRGFVGDKSRPQQSVLRRRIILCRFGSVP